MNKLITVIAAVRSLISVALEIALLVLFVLGRYDFMQLLIGWCMLRIAEFCVMKVAEWKRG